MRKLQVYSFVLVAALAVGLAACGDDDSSFNPRDESSTDVIESSDARSSSGAASSESKSSDSGRDTEGSGSETSSSETSSSGISGGEERSSSSGSSPFSVGEDRSVYDAEKNTLTDYRDGQVYKTLTIGLLTWMAENLNFAYLEASDTLDSTSFCYDEDPFLCAKYGRLYTWAAAMDSVAIFSDDGKGCGDGCGKGCGDGEACSSKSPVRGVCPKDWHLSTITEWRYLVDMIGSPLEANQSLRSTDGWFGDNNGGTDAYGFSVRPAGYRIHTGGYNDNGSRASFWTSEEDSGKEAYSTGFYANLVWASYVDEKSLAYSVRCVKD